MVLLSNSCKVSKDISAPDLHLPGVYRNASTDTTTIAKLPWKSFFSSPVLEEMIDSAMIHNNDLQVAMKNLEAAHLVLNQSKIANLPTLSIGITTTTARPSDNSMNGLSLSQFLAQKHIEDYTTSAIMSWEADIWGKIRNRKASALATYLQTFEARNTVQTQVIASVSQGYYNLLTLDEQLKIARKNLALNDSTLRIIRLQYQAGQTTSLAEQQADAQRLMAAQLVPQFEQEIAIQENALSVIMGRYPGKIIRPVTLAEIAIPSSLATGIPSLLLSLRPDIRSAELAIDRANAEVGIAKAQMYPSLVITAEGGVNAFKGSNWFNIPASLFGTATAGLTQPVLQRKQLKTQLEVAKIEREKSVIRFRQQVLVGVKEVSDALTRLEELSEQQQLASRRARTMRAATGNATMLFKTGMANYLEVITAQSNVLQSELDLAAIKRARLFAMIELYRSVGGGWH